MFLRILCLAAASVSLAFLMSLPDAISTLASDGMLASLYAELSLPLPTTGLIIACHGFGCEYRTEIRLTGADRTRLGAIMAIGRAAPVAERRAVAAAVSWLDRRVGPDAGTTHRVARAGAHESRDPDIWTASTSAPTIRACSWCSINCISCITITLSRRSRAASSSTCGCRTRLPCSKRSRAGRIGRSTTGPIRTGSCPISCRWSSGRAAATEGRTQPQTRTNHGKTVRAKRDTRCHIEVGVRSRTLLNSISMKVTAVSATPALVRYVNRLPDVRLEFMGEAFLAGDLRLSILDRLPAYRDRDRAGELTRLRKRWKQVCGFVVACRQVLNQLSGCGLDHRIRHATRLRGDYPKRKAWKYV